jgi:hypothetical protein
VVNLLLRVVDLFRARAIFLTIISVFNSKSKILTQDPLFGVHENVAKKRAETAHDEARGPGLRRGGEGGGD